MPQVPPVPLCHAHAHHDYRNRPPLLAALAAGFTSIEADVWLDHGEVLVGHDPGDLGAGRTLRATYLDPLVARVREGALFADPQVALHLLVDVKSDAAPTRLALESVLRDYAEVVTHWRDGVRVDRPVRVVVSGNRDLPGMLADPGRSTTYDGRLPDLDRDIPAEVMAMVSDDWRRHFRWRGVGPMPAGDRARLAHLVGAAHARGHLLRFWGTPRTPPARGRVWAALLDAGVDLVNGDDLAALRRFLLARRTRSRLP